MLRLARELPTFLQYLILLLAPWEKSFLSETPEQTSMTMSFVVRTTERVLAILLLALSMASATAGEVPRAAVSIDLPIRSFELDNGLRVYVLEDHSTPAFSLRTVFDVGARDEKPGLTGFAHLFEHMMFKGSARVPDGGHFKYIEGIGGQSNASTSWDRTDYWNELPSNYLDRALWLESERLRNLAVTEENFRNQRDAVKEEMARRYNRPYSEAMESFTLATFAGTPYGHSVIGSVEDLDRGGVAEARAFFTTYYTPNNAVIAIAGDVEFEQVRARVRKYYGDIPRGQPRPPAVSVDPAPREGFRKTMQDPLARLPFLVLGWHTVSAAHPDRHALSLLASILFGGDSARLKQRLIDEEQLALDVGGYGMVERDIGALVSYYNPAPGVSFERLRDAVRDELRRIDVDGVSATELEKVRNRRLVTTLSSLATNSGRVEAIGDGALYFDNPRHVLTELAGYEDVSVRDIQRVVRKYLGDEWLEMEITPGGESSERTQSVAGSASSSGTTETVSSDIPQPPTGGPPRPVNFPEIVERRLQNGMTVYVVEDHDVPLVTAWLVANAGSIYAPLLPELTGEMLLEGTTKHSRAEMLQSIEQMGGKLEADVGLHTAAVSTKVLSRDLPRALQLLAETVRSPALPSDSLEKLKRMSRAGVESSKGSASSLASKLFGVASYPRGHPYGRPFPADEEIEQVDVAAIRDFHERMYRPDNAYIILAGDITMEQAIEPVQQQFGDWQGREDRPPLADPLMGFADWKPAASADLTVHLVDREGSAQARIVVGNVAIPHRHPQWIPLRLATSILGGSSTGRLFKDLREVQGLAYSIGAYVQPRRGPGAFKVSTGTRPGNAAAMLQGIFEHLQRMRSSTPEAGEFESTVRKAVGSFPMEIETAEQIAYLVNTVKSYDLPWHYYRTYRDRVRATTAESVREAAGHYMGERPRVVIVGPADELEPQIRQALPAARIIRYDTDLRPLAADNADAATAARSSGAANSSSPESDAGSPRPDTIAPVDSSTTS